MKKLFHIIILITLISPVKANTLYELIKIPNLEIYDLNTPNKLRYVYAKQPFTIGLDNNINCYNSSNTDLKKKYEVIRNELDKYDQLNTDKIESIVQKTLVKTNCSVLFVKQKHNE